MQAHSVRMLNAVTSANGVPTLATDGYAPTGTMTKFRFLGMEGRFSRASGTATFRLRIWGYQPKLKTTADVDIASSAAWIALFDTETLTYTANFNEAFAIEAADVFTRYYVELVAVTGTTATVTASLSFGEN